LLEFLPTRSEMVTTLTAQMSDLLAPNIQIYDAHVVDLYQWVGARYLVGVKENEGKAQLSLGLDRISELITLAFQTLSRPEAIRGSATLYFDSIWRRECQSIPIERTSIFDLPRLKPTV
jgi:hypothetical protein